MSRTLILVKPDAFERALTGEVIARFERKGLRIAALKTMRADEPIANKHYEEHTEKPFFGELVSFITGGTLVAMVLEGHEAVAAARQLIGATNPVEAAPGSIRGDFALEVTFNMVHGSDSDESAEREIGIWFPELLASGSGRGSRLTFSVESCRVLSPRGRAEKVQDVPTPAQEPVMRSPRIGSPSERDSRSWGGVRGRRLRGRRAQRGGP